MAPLRVSLKQVVVVIEDLETDDAAYLHRHTGEIVVVPADVIELLEDEEASENLPHWKIQNISRIREAQESEDFLLLPGSFEIDEAGMMDRFIDTLEDESHREQLQDMLDGEDGEKRFEDIVHKLGLDDGWNAYRHEAMVAVAVEWLESQGIAFDRDA